MSTRTILIGAVALVVGLAAAFGVLKYRQGFAGTSEETVTVVVAAVDIPRGSVATRDMFTTKEFPKSVAPKGVVASVDEAANRVPKDTLIMDEPVLEVRLSAKGVGPGFSHVIPPGMRAISIKTPSAATIGGGFILPGNKVDVLFTRRSQGMLQNDPTGGGSSTLLVQLVEVLAINQKTDQTSDSKMDVKDLQTATLLVSPEQMMKIELAQNLGVLTLVLRNGNDKAASDVGPYLGNDIRYTVGKPFTEQIQDASAAVSKAWEQMQAEMRKTAKETADAEKVAMEKAMKEEAERMKAMKEENDRLKAELEQEKEKERVRLEKLAQAQPKAAPEAQAQPLKVRTLRNNIPGSVDVPANNSNR